MSDKKKSVIYVDREERTEWFRNDRLGVWFHWGLYSIPARGEWVRSVEKLTIKDYQKYFDEFNPDSYNANEWARIAKESGMKYGIMTTKHHDGFCLFDSKLTEYKSTNTQCGRDLIKEYVDAFRNAGLKVGIYYSLVDWYHEDYPAYGDRQHPMRDNEEYINKKHNFDRYLEYMHGQIRELCTNYGKIDIMWFDFSYWEYRGEAWKATELVKMIRSLQPGIIINNRLGGDIEASIPDIYSGDFASPEQSIPREIMVDVEGDPIPWEGCMTLNSSWGYSVTDNAYKTSEFVIRTLVNCVSKNGNLIINVGPDAIGRIPEKSLKILGEIRDWMKEYGESIYGCKDSHFEKPEWGYFTQKGDILYAHIFNQVLGHINLKGMKGKVEKARLLPDMSEVILTEFWNANNGVDKLDSKDDIYMAFGIPVQNTYELPDKRVTVIKLYLK